MIAIKETTAQAIHLLTLLKDFGKAQEAPTTVHMDSKAALDSLISENFSKRLKHLTITRQWICEQLESGIIEVKHVLQQPRFPFIDDGSR